MLYSEGPFFSNKKINCVSPLLLRKQLISQSPCKSAHVPVPAFAIYPSSWQRQTRRNGRTLTALEKLNLKWKAPKMFLTWLFWWHLLLVTRCAQLSKSKHKLRTVQLWLKMQKEGESAEIAPDYIPAASACFYFGCLLPSNRMAALTLLCVHIASMHWMSKYSDIIHIHST